jgi:hypothetical protein
MKMKVLNVAKSVPIMMIIMMMILLAACGKGDDLQSKDTVKLLESGTYYYEGTFYDGSNLDGYTIKLAVKESEFVIAFFDQEGVELGRSINIKGKGYYVDTSAKEYTRDTYYDDVTYAYSGLEYIESGKTDLISLAGVEDKNMHFEKYEATYGSATGVMQFIFKDDKLFAIQEDFTDATGAEISEAVIIKKISSEIPKDWFRIPKDYTETE